MYPFSQWILIFSNCILTDSSVRCSRVLPSVFFVVCLPKNRVVFTILINFNKKASIHWEDSALPISGYWPTSEPNERRLMTQWRNGCRAMRRSFCATQVLPVWFIPFAFRYQGNGATPCQYIDTTRKVIDCATTLLLTGFIWWHFAADLNLGWWLVGKPVPSSCWV